MHNNCHDL